MGHESVLHAKTMGYPCVYTDHSLFGYGDLACININKVMKTFMTEIDAVVNVSHICKQNFCMRARFHPRNAYVIPNGIDSY